MYDDDDDDDVDPYLVLVPVPVCPGLGHLATQLARARPILVQHVVQAPALLRLSNDKSALCTINQSTSHT